MQYQPLIKQDKHSLIWLSSRRTYSSRKISWTSKSFLIRSRNCSFATCTSNHPLCFITSHNWKRWASRLALRRQVSGKSPQIRSKYTSRCWEMFLSLQRNWTCSSAIFLRKRLTTCMTLYGWWSCRATTLLVTSLSRFTWMSKASHHHSISICFREMQTVTSWARSKKSSCLVQGHWFLASNLSLCLLTFCPI